MGKKKAKNLGVGIDFKRVKHKVGKKLPRAQNETNVDFKARAINLPSQAVREDRSGTAVNYQNLTLQELLSQTTHHNDKSRKHSLVGLADLFNRHPEQLRQQAAQVLSTLAERVADGDEGVRSALRTLLHGTVLPTLGATATRPFMPIIMAHVCGAMTHLSLDVRNDALLFLDLLMDHVPHLVVDGYLAPCLAHFGDLLSSAHRSRSIKAQSLASLNKILNALCSFLSRAFPRTSTMQQQRQQPAAAGDGSSTDAKQQQQLPGPGPGSEALQWAGAIGGARCRWPARTPGMLTAELEGMLQQVAATGMRAKGSKRNGASGGSGASGSGRKSSQRKPGIATEAAAGGGGGTAGGAAGALGSPRSGSAPGEGSAPTAMAAALAAASDVRASALRLLLLLMDCWLECAPSQLATLPEAEQASALALIATASNVLLQRLMLLQQGARAADTTSGGSGSCEAAPTTAAAPTAHGSVSPGQLQLLEELHGSVLKRVVPFFPTTMPTVKPSAAVMDALVRYNLQSAQLLAAFLPLPAAGPAAAATTESTTARGGGAGPLVSAMATGGAVAPGPAAWATALVSYYSTALDAGVLVPAPQGSLLMSDVAPAGAVPALPVAAADAVMASVAGMVRCLDAGEAQRLMAAVAAYAARQSARSSARLACISMQHELLKAAVSGSLYLDEQVVAGWLTPLPKLLWDLGAAAPDVTAAALRLLLDASRYAPAGSHVQQHMTTLQPQLVPIFAALLPPKAGKAALAKHRQQQQHAGAAASGSSAPAVAAVLPGVTPKLPTPVAELAVDLLMHVGPLGPALLKPLSVLLSSRILPWPLAHRVLEVVLRQLEASADPALAASWLLTLLFGPHLEQLLLTPEGADVSADLAWHMAVADAAAKGLQRLGGAAALLALLTPQLMQLPLWEAATAGARGARARRYSLVRLCVCAAQDAAGVQLQAPADSLAAAGSAASNLPSPLLDVLPAAAALCAAELSVAEDLEVASALACGALTAQQWHVAHHDQRASVANSLLAQLLTATPQLASAVLESLLCKVLTSLAALAAAQQQEAQPAPGPNVLPPAAAIAAVMRIAQLVVKLAPCRRLLLQEEGRVLAWVKDTSAVVRALPAAVAGDGKCASEAQRLVQTVADVYGVAALTLQAA